MATLIYCDDGGHILGGFLDTADPKSNMKWDLQNGRIPEGFSFAVVIDTKAPQADYRLVWQPYEEK